MRILVAEDDAVSRRVLETTLSKWGYDVGTMAAKRGRSCEVTTFRSWRFSTG